jgi:hypothetical protein
MTNTKLSILRIFVILLYFSYVCLSKHNCNHNDLLKTFSPIIQEQIESSDVHRRLQTTITRPIKILFDSSNISGATAEQLDFIVNKLAPVGAEFFRLRLKVITIGTLKFAADKCNQVG